MKEWRIWCDICHKETDGNIKIIIKNNGSEKQLDVCKDCYDNMKTKCCKLQKK